VANVFTRVNQATELKIGRAPVPTLFRLEDLTAEPGTGPGTYGVSTVDGVSAHLSLGPGLKRGAVSVLWWVTTYDGGTTYSINVAGTGSSNISMVGVTDAQTLAASAARLVSETIALESLTGTSVSTISIPQVDGTVRYGILIQDVGIGGAEPTLTFDFAVSGGSGAAAASIDAAAIEVQIHGLLSGFEGQYLPARWDPLDDHYYTGLYGYLSGVGKKIDVAGYRRIYPQVVRYSERAGNGANVGTHAWVVVAPAGPEGT